MLYLVHLADCNKLFLPLCYAKLIIPGLFLTARHLCASALGLGCLISIQCHVIIGLVEGKLFLYSKLIIIYLMFKSTHEHRVSSQFTHITWTEFPHLSCNAVFFNQRFLYKQYGGNYYCYTFIIITVEPI